MNEITDNQNCSGEIIHWKIRKMRSQIYITLIIGSYDSLCFSGFWLLLRKKSMMIECHNLIFWSGYGRSAKPVKGDGAQKTLDLKSRLNITVAAYDLKGKLLYVNEAASGNAFQMCNGSFIEFDAAFNFGTRYVTCSRLIS